MDTAEVTLDYFTTLPLRAVSVYSMHVCPFYYKFKGTVCEGDVGHEMLNN